MSSSIFNISSWSNSAVYNKHDIIVYTDNRYYYAKAGVPANNPPVYSSVISNSDAYWGGYFQHPVIKKDYPLFIWRPSYQTQANFEPKVSVIKYGDGYEKRVSDQINFNLLNFELNFDGLTLDECTAILHFFSARSAKTAFIYYPSAPYTVATTDAKLFVCRRWGSSNPFFNNFSIKATFEEVPA
jgi:phage-related protein